MYNSKRYKAAQQRGQYPPSSLPSAVQRMLRMRKDPYKLDRNPGDGEGQKLTTPGSIGMMGDAPDGGAPGFGSNERDGYPRGTSQFEDPGDERQDLPKDTDPDDPFNSSNDTRTEYGRGQDTDYGQALHDDPRDGSGDSAIGIHQTVLDQLSGSERDRKTDIATMPSVPHNEIRRRTPFNQLRSSSPLVVVRDSQIRRRNRS